MIEAQEAQEAQEFEEFIKQAKKNIPDKKVTIDQAIDMFEGWKLARQVQEWQPIETAPKDRRILIRDESKANYAVGIWDSITEEFVIDYRRKPIDSYWWMELPK